jgi:hypothetical protein
MVYILLDNINEHKATGPDTILGKLLKELASEISPILTMHPSNSEKYQTKGKRH